MKNVLAALLKTMVTVALFYLLFRKVDFHDFWATLRTARFNLLLLGFAVLCVGHYVCLFRWRLLMRPLMPVPSLAQLLKIYCIGLFFNLAFPTVVGGDVVKMYYAGKPSRQYAQSFAATFLDRDAGMLAMMIIACYATLAHPVSIPGVPVSLIVWGAFAAFLLVNGAIFTPSVHRLLTSLLHRMRMPRIAGKMDRLSSAFQILGRERNVLLGSLAISLVNQFLVISVTWLISEALRLDLSILYFLAFVPVVTLVSMIPVSLNGMGLRDYAFRALFSAVGVSPASCLALSLLYFSTMILSAIPGGVLYAFFKDKRDAREMAAFEADFS